MNGCGTVTARAATAMQAEQALAEFETKWIKYPAIARLWREQWIRVVPFFALPPGAAQNRIHDERCGSAASQLAADHQDARLVSERRSGHQAHLSRDRQSQPRMAHDSELEACLELLRNGLRRPVTTRTYGE